MAIASPPNAWDLYITGKVQMWVCEEKVYFRLSIIVDTLQIHETFAVGALVSARKLAVVEDKLNVNGGAIAIGHPSGASGARIVSHLTHELR